MSIYKFVVFQIDLNRNIYGMDNFSHAPEYVEAWCWSFKFDPATAPGTPWTRFFYCA